MSFMSFMSFYNEFRNELWQDSEQVLAPYVGIPQISFGTQCWAAGCPRRQAGSRGGSQARSHRQAGSRPDGHAGRQEGPQLATRKMPADARDVVLSAAK